MLRCPASMIQTMAGMTMTDDQMSAASSTAAPLECRIARLKRSGPGWAREG